MRTKHLELEETKERCHELQDEVSQLRDRLTERAQQVTSLSSERHKHILEAYDMK